MTLPWFRVPVKTHSSKAMHDYYLWELGEHAKITDMPGHVFDNIKEWFTLWTYFAGPLLSVFLIFLPWAWRDRRIRVPVAMCLAGVLAVGLEQSRYPHYFAPATAAFLIVLLQSARHMYAIGARRKPAMLAMVRLAPAMLALVVVARAALPALQTRDSGIAHSLSWCCNAPGNLARARLMDRLEGTEGRHLVIVQYGPQHNALHEWVYNEPQIDQAKVVWARDMGESANRELMHYFADRQVWWLAVDDDSKSPDFRAIPSLPSPKSP